MRPKIAVIGGGISGIYAAHFLQKWADVDLYEKTSQLGGHAYTITTGVPSPCDLGFVIFNTFYYPLFTAFLHELNVFNQTSPTEMSFASESPTHRLWLGPPSLNALLRSALKGTLLPSAKIAFLLRSELPRLKRLADEGAHMSIQELLDQIPHALAHTLISPLIQIIWSLPEEALLETSADFILAYFRQHGLIDTHREGHWRSFPNGSITYINAFTKSFKGRVFLQADIENINRTNNGVTVQTPIKQNLYNAVVIATNARIARSLVRDITPLEQECLSAFSFHNKTINLHSERALLPYFQGTWNVQDIDGKKIVSYDLSKIHAPLHRKNFFVSWGDHLPQKQNLITQQNFEHPCFSEASRTSQQSLAQLNNDGRIVYCGAYFGSGFHEDGCQAAYSAVQSLKNRFQIDS